MMRIQLVAAFFILAVVFSSCAQVSGKRTLFSSGDYDVVLEATPFKVKGVTSESVVDAVEEGLNEVGFDSAVVLFEINKVLVGEFTQVRAGGASRLQQMKDAAHDGDFWKIIKSDFTDPNELTEQKWISVAVRDPKKTFGFESWGTPTEKRYKLYLKHIPEQLNSYMLVKSHVKS